MQNKWTASVSKTDEQQPAPEKNNSKKIGLAMGIVGAVLVTAGAAPMLFGNADNLTGDVTDTQEAVDPLVALLSGGTTTSIESPVPTATPIATPTAKPLSTPVATVAPTNTAVTTTDKTVKVTNKNTGTADKTGEEFHNASPLSNTSIETGNTSIKTNGNNTSITTGNTSIKTTGNNTSITTGNTSVQTNKQVIKTPKNIQTGLDANLMLGLLFLIASGALFIRSRKSA